MDRHILLIYSSVDEFALFIVFVYCEYYCYKHLFGLKAQLFYNLIEL